MNTDLKRSPLPALLSNPAWQRTGSYYLLVICLGLGNAIIGPTLPALAAQTRSQLGDLGLAFLVSSMGFTLGTVLASRVIDHVSPHAAIGVAQLASAGAIVLVPLAPSLPVLLAVLVFKGLADGVVNAGANTLLVWVHRDKVGPFMNGMHFCFGVGAFSAPLLVAQVIGTPGGYRWVYWAVAGIGLVASLLALALRESPKPEHHPERTAEEGHLELPVITSAALMLFCYVGAEVAFGGWVYTYAVQLRLASAVGAAYLTSAFWLAFTIGRLISIPMATRVAARTTILGALAGCLALLVGAIALPGSSAVVWTLAIGLGLCMAPIWPTGYTLAGQSVRFTARASAMILLGDSFGGMVLPWLSGQVIERAGAQAMLYLVLGSVAGTLLAFGAMQYWRRAAARPVLEL